ncbi:hypothetical protein FACS1894116_02300 [Betaproteobacteria bacterium]|nr:hypothetical protein FACS1894116_02300 [Betaproteobacteria bacterium]GHT97297.1 hypothetical protein FACS1894154_00330 [Betaproteobacteria bacterium]GHU26684.1 hypothetical protein FACS189488_14840 [Betaproteobacteria bacterium]GHU27547.1 hypothetical protein FACS189497_00990 [Betaproteobacteria bacterium]
MKKTALLVATLLLAALHHSAALAAPTLNGTWKSSRELTMAFLRNNVRLQPRSEHFLEQLMGHLTVHFDGQNITHEMPDLEIEINNVKRPFKGLREQNTYKVLFTNATTVAIQSRELFTQNEYVQIYHFVDDDTVWIYVGDSEAASRFFPHLREYFIRVK